MILHNSGLGAKRPANIIFKSYMLGIRKESNVLGSQKWSRLVVEGTLSLRMSRQ
jgi:hypothetical protein